MYFLIHLFYTRFFNSLFALMLCFFYILHRISSIFWSLARYSQFLALCCFIWIILMFNAFGANRWIIFFIFISTFRYFFYFHPPLLITLLFFILIFLFATFYHLFILLIRYSIYLLCIFSIFDIYPNNCF
jgi:hypothetical protein